MENPTNKPTSEPTTGTHNQTAATMPFPTSAGPLWIGVEVVNRTDRDDTLCAAHGGWRLIWLRNLAHAETVCADPCPTCEPLCVVFERAGVRVSIDYANDNFQDFIESCQDELIHNEPTWDDPAEEALTRDAVRFLHAMI
jgi:hypothetical protein